MSKEDNDFLSQLVNETYDFLLNFAKVRLRDINSAQDAVQETYLAAQKNWKNLWIMLFMRIPLI